MGLAIVEEKPIKSLDEVNKNVTYHGNRDEDYHNITQH